MDWEFLIPLLMFAFPVVVALLDKRAKQKRAASPPPKPSMHRPSPISFEEFSREFSPEAAGGVAPENRNPAGSQEFGQEGIRAVHKNGPQEAPKPVQPADKLKIDKKKLIIYSEILKPKFDA